MQSPSKALDRGGIVSNLDLVPIDDDVREHDELFGKFQDAQRSWESNQWYGNLDEPMRDGSPKVVDRGVAFVSVAEIKAAWAAGKSFGPIGHRSDGTLVYPAEVKEAMRLGYVCPKCAAKQEVVGSTVCWPKGEDKSSGCEYTRVGSTGW